MSKKQRIGAWIIIDDCEKFIAKCSKCGRVVDSRLISKFPYCRCGTKMEEAERKGSGEMRDILFRGQRLDSKEWVYGYYANCHGADLEKHTTGHFIIEYPDKYHEIYTDTIGQYTGLCDKNGVKIFEGDIVENDEDLYVVEWSEDEARFVLNGDGVQASFDNFWEYELEVIGNIYENKELLEGNR